MPGFMQSLKSRLPQSPFGPAKPNTNETSSAEDSSTTQEPAPTEVLPGKALVQQGSSTVALSLASASRHGSVDGHLEEQVIQSEVTENNVPSTLESAKPIEPAESSTLQPVDVTGLNQTAAAALLLDTPDELVMALMKEVTEPEVSAPEAAATDAGVSESLTSNADPIQLQENVQPQTETPQVANATTEQDTELMSNAPLAKTPTAPNEEAAVEVIVKEASDETELPTQDKQDMAVNTEVEKGNAALGLAKSKSKKKRFEFAHIRKSISHSSNEANSEGGLLSPKSCKNQLLSEKLKHAMQQVRAKVKKDKEVNKVQELPAEEKVLEA